MTFGENTFYLPEYEIVSTGVTVISTDEEAFVASLKKGIGKDFIYLRPRGDKPYREYKFEQKWRIEKRPKLWEQFFAIDNEKDILGFTKRYGVLGLWNPFMPMDIFNRFDMALESKEGDYSSLRAGYDSQEILPSLGLPTNAREALQKNASLFQYSLCKPAEAIQEWKEMQSCLAIFIALCDSYRTLLHERAKFVDDTLKKQAKQNAKQALQDLTNTYFELQKIIKPTNEPNFTDKEFEEWAASPVKNRIILAQEFISSVVGLILMQTKMTIRPSQCALWAFDSEPKSLFHLICLDFIFDLVLYHAGVNKPCDNREGRTPCTKWVQMGQKYCSKKCKNAVAKRMERARSKIRTTPKMPKSA